MHDMVKEAVQSRYGAGAKAVEAALCCPVDYDPQYLKAIPAEVIEKDYGCGDPSKYVRAGETVLDLGSGTGKICFIASQVVGPKGKVIGIDMTPDMLDVARRNAPIVADKIGFANVEFRRGNIQDLQTNLELIDKRLATCPVTSATDLELFQRDLADMRCDQPLVASDSVDVIVSNCVLNLVADVDKPALFAEMHRVLKRGGRIAISDIVSDEPSPAHLKDDPKLWSGCLSGALQEFEFLKLLEDVGFHGIQVTERQQEPWQIIEGIEYRSITVMAWKGKSGECWDKNQAVIYQGPFHTVLDDDNHKYRRGQPMAVCGKTFALLMREPYAGLFAPVPPYKEVTEPAPFDCTRDTVRHASETKTGVPVITRLADGPVCAPGSECC
ncbi:MAG: methyltransferase domain-containing protein [Rhodospirillaceae bacterium]|nr:methyltransferase domain-containing protein [Rhodospirillaceae bacterium]